MPDLDAVELLRTHQLGSIQLAKICELRGVNRERINARSPSCFEPLPYWNYRNAGISKLYVGRVGSDVGNDLPGELVAGRCKVCEDEVNSVGRCRFRPRDVATDRCTVRSKGQVHRE